MILFAKYVLKQSCVILLQSIQINNQLIILFFKTMKFNIKYGAITLFYIFSNVVILHAIENKNEINFNNDWKFQLSDSANYSFVNYNDDSWRLLNLPHDWSVEFPFDSIKGEGCTGYFRITSYNVCYTKLLRSATSSAHGDRTATRGRFPTCCRSRRAGD